MVEPFSFTGPPSIIWVGRYDPTLPRPWKGLIDPSTGWLYFWNPETNVTQYERPSAPLYHHQFQLQQYPYPWLPRYDRPQLQYSHQYPEPLSTSHAPICASPCIPIAVRAPHPVTVPINYPRYRSLIREEGEDRDRISELPDDLICHILSFLPTITAVRTTVLSKRWNKLWTFVRHLDFDLYRDRPDGQKYLFERFVEFVFLRLVSLDIGKFRLRYASASWEGDFSHVDDWVSVAVWRNVVELDLRIFYVASGYLCRLPKSIFWCKTLKVLKLWIEDIAIPDPPTKGCFPSLKVLHVTLIDPDDKLGKLLSYFPVVEDLSIHVQMRYSYNFYSNFNLKVSTPELKTLKLSMEREERRNYEMERDYGGTLKQNHFCVDAPKLENLDLVQIPLSNYILENPKSVVNASIAFKSLAEEWSSFPDLAFQLLTGISNVKCLSLSDHPFEASNLPVFGNLNQLKLVLRNCSSWEFLAALLHRTPNLEDLDLVLEDELLFYAQRTGGEKDYPELQWTPPELVPNCLSSHLKTISIRGFKGLQFEMKVVKYMLLNGCHLNKMTIYTSMLEKEEEYCRDLLSFQRVMTCQVEFREMQF
ncbi:F-box/FBD/LRR-repeat protein At5g56420-like [Rosa rugosa]|uniref:F-box/FBD/LRR-repeat protein At5g56420-like n=1 Tax=Rosa rugosa TaxID=74645 RepID=UPI002B40A0FA|nr:F-box/FBD/LRR-repeat protein At5g56420-like [Rosa rugosa]